MKTNITVLNEPVAGLAYSEMGERIKGSKWYTATHTYKRLKVFKPKKSEVEPNEVIKSFYSKVQHKPFDDREFNAPNEFYGLESTRDKAIRGTASDVISLKDVVGIGETVILTAGQRAKMFTPTKWREMSEPERNEVIDAVEPEISQESYIHYNALQATWNIIYRDLETHHPTRKFDFYFPLDVYQEQRGRYQAKILLAKA